MTSSELFAQLILMGILVFFASKAWRNFKLAAKEFSDVWSKDPLAKQLSFFQLLMALASGSSFSLQSKIIKEYTSAAIGCLLVVLVLFFQGKQIYPLTVQLIDETPIGGEILFEGDGMQNSQSPQSPSQSELPNKTLQPTTNASPD